MQIWFGWKNVDKIEQYNNNQNNISDILKEYTAIIENASDQLTEIYNIFDYILPKEYEDSIDLICEYNEISKEELLRLSLVMYMHYFNKNVHNLPNKIKPFKHRNIFDAEFDTKPKNQE